jgi:hypothetical protein
MKITLGLFEFFQKFAEIFTSQGTPLVSTTPAANLTPVSTTPPVSTSINVTGGKFTTGVNDQWQRMGLISDSLHLKVKVKKCIIILTYYPVVSKQIFNIF